MATSTGTTPAPGSSFLNTAIPGFANLNNKSSDVINNLLNGSPNPSTTQNAAATFGTTNGFGTGSGIANRFGYDLYQQQGNQRQQQGLGDLSSLISSIAQPTLQNQQQNQQNQQFYSGLGQGAQEFNASQAANNNNQINALIAQLSGQGNGQSLGPASVSPTH